MNKTELKTDIKPNQKPLFTWIDGYLKNKMEGYQTETDKSFRFQVTEALIDYFEKIEAQKELESAG